MLVVFVPISFIKAPEERHIVSLLRSCRLFACLSATNISLLMELKPVDVVNLTPMGASPPS